jgi:NAD(P)-dependent dehydrogenase (short-subunit alcohol dehydrogenase family)
LVGGQNFLAYNASKGGVRLLTKSVALHGARLDPQVRCNSVHPPFSKVRWSTISCRKRNIRRRARRITRDIPLGRFGTAVEVADMCVYLLSDESRFVPAPNSLSTAD